MALTVHGWEWVLKKYWFLSVLSQLEWTPGYLTNLFLLWSYCTFVFEISIHLLTLFCREGLGLQQNRMEVTVISRTPFTVGLTLGVIHSKGLDKWIITCIHYHNIMQSSFTALKSSVPCLFIFSSPPALATPDPFTVSIVLSFWECHIDGVVRYAASQVDFCHSLIWI